MALRDILLKYRNGKLWTDKDVDLAGALTVQGFAVGQPDALGPGDNNMVAWNYHPAGVSTTGSLLTSGTLYLNKVVFRNKKSSVTKLWRIQGTAGATPTSGQNFMGLYDSTGALLSSVNIDAQVTDSNGPKSATLDTPLSNLVAGTYFVGLLFNAGTVPVIYRTAQPFTADAMANQSASQYNHATNGTSLTALPSSVTLSSNALGQSIWVGVS